MHYVANAKYWLERHYGVSKWPAKSYDPDPLEAFKSTVVFGALEQETVPELDQLEAWCKARLPELITKMREECKLG